MYETLSEQFVDAQAFPLSDPEATHAVTDEPDTIGPLSPDADSFLDLLSALGRRPLATDRTPVIAGYQAWIDRNSSASAALYAAWFNLGVELTAAGDKDGAIEAYRNALALRPGFYPAAINLGTLLEATGQPEAALMAWQQGLQSDNDRTALLEFRDRLTEARRVRQQAMPSVLHIGCGAAGSKALPAVFLGPDWRVIRADLDPDAGPDVVAGLTDMRAVSDGLADAVYTSTPIEHLYPHQVAPMLRELHRALKPDGFALLQLPDLQEVAHHIAEGRLDDALYISPLGPITPLDMLYGHRTALASGTTTDAPRTGFTSATIAAALIGAGFAAALVQRDPASFSLTVIAFRSLPDQGRMTQARTQMLPAADQPVVLYTQSG